VCYVDYGFSENVEKSKAYKLNPKFCSLSFQATKCKLAGKGIFKRFFPCSSVCLVLFFEVGSPSIAQAGFEFRSSYLSLPSVGMYHHAQLFPSIW
jgi:hypothetical protein